jgi:hypothetical protein
MMTTTTRMESAFILILDFDPLPWAVDLKQFTTPANICDVVNAG